MGKEANRRKSKSKKPLNKIHWRMNSISLCGFVFAFIMCIILIFFFRSLLLFWFACVCMVLLCVSVLVLVIIHVCVVCNYFFFLFVHDERKFYTREVPSLVCVCVCVITHMYSTEGKVYTPMAPSLVKNTA